MSEPREGVKWQIMLGVDRLDYSKGIPERLLAFEQALNDHPELREHLVLEQIVVPSREQIDEYRQLKNKIEHLVARINGRFSTLSWTPVHYLYRSLSRPELLKAYRRASIALITPLRDGMNLVAKEFCASKTNLNGVLILSEFAGATIELKDACLLVNPYDIKEMASTIQEAFHLSSPVKKRLMQRARQKIQQMDVHWWQNKYLMAALEERGERKTNQTNNRVTHLLKKTIWKPAMYSLDKGSSFHVG